MRLDKPKAMAEPRVSCESDLPNRKLDVGTAPLTKACWVGLGACSSQQPLLCWPNRLSVPRRTRGRSHPRGC